MLGQTPVDPALERVRLRATGTLGLVDRLEPGRGPVGEDDVEGAHVVDGHAVAQAAAAGGVVAGHAADGGPVAGGGVRAEQQPVRCRGLVELVLHDADVDDGGACLRVELVDPVEVAGGVEHQPGADGLAGQAGPGATRRDRYAERGGRRDRRGDVVGVPRVDDAQRADRVHARVAGEQVAAVVVEGHLALEVALEPSLQLATGTSAPVRWAARDRVTAAPAGPARR